jgi:hypothetical protein
MVVSDDPLASWARQALMANAMAYGEALQRTNVARREYDAPSRRSCTTAPCAGRPARTGVACPTSAQIEWDVTVSPYPHAVDGFALSERWCAWKDVDVIFTAARAAVEAGPLDPPLCEVVFDEEYDPFTVDTLEEAHEHLTHNRVRSMEIILSHIDEDEARVTLHYSGERLQLNGYGSDWRRARAAYDAAQAELAGHFGITTFELPKLPRDTVAETRRRLVLEELEAALEAVDSDPERD